MIIIFFLKTISSVVSLFISTNVGTIGFCLLGLFTYLGEDSAFQSSSSAIYLLMGVLLFLQSLVYWVVYFLKKNTFEVWGLLLSCKSKGALKELNKKNSNLDSVLKSHTSSTSDRKTSSRGDGDKSSKEELERDSSNSSFTTAGVVDL
jgi:hypothetical protein